MNFKEIRQMVNLMNENDIMEIEVEREGTKVKIKKSYAEAQPQVITQQVQPRRDAQQLAQEEDQTKSVAASSNRIEVKSPMVGTFYRAPSPDAAPYVDIGQVIEVGQVLCIVEAMKLMNEIKSEVRGKIVEIPAENTHPVEFGQVLFTVEPV